MVLESKKALAEALNKPFVCPHEGNLRLIHKFGHKWIILRESFAVTAFHATLILVRHLAAAIFHSVWAAIHGFSDQSLNDLTILQWKNIGTDTEVVIKSIIGILCPPLARWVDNRILPTSKEDEELKSPPYDGRQELIG